MLTIEVLKGDITKIETDVIVNAANSSLLGGSGVDGAIHRAGGKQILEECITIRNKQGGCKVGNAVYTSGGNLLTKYVIHTVGPRWNTNEDDCVEQLRNCYKNSLLLAENLKAKTIAFPNISTGIYQFPKKLAAEIAIGQMKIFENENLEKVIFVCFDEENMKLYRELLNI